MTFEWDPQKASANLRKHGVRFADAVSALEDEHASTVPEQSDDEERWITLGLDSIRSRPRRRVHLAPGEHSDHFGATGDCSGMPPI